MPFAPRIALVRSHPAALVALLAAAIGAGYGAWYFAVGQAVETYRATRGDLVQSVVANGQVVTPQRASIASEVTARVVRIAVEEGDTVRREQVLIELDQSDEKAAVVQARAALAQAEAKVRQVEKSALPAAEQALRQAQANLRQAQLALDRTKDLVGKNFLSRAQLDDAQRNLDVAESQARAAQVAVDSNGPEGSDRQVADSGRVAAESAIAVAQAKLDATVIRAPADGVLIGRSVEPGDVAQAGKELMVLAPAGEMQVVVNIDEKNLGKLAVGQHAMISADAYPGQSFPGEVFYINPGIDPVRGAVEVKLRVPEPPAYIRQDMSVSVDISVGRRGGVLIVPANAVRDAAGAHPWVLVVRDGKTVRQPVSLGMRGDAAIEVLDGLVENDALVPATNAIIVAGTRIRPVAVSSGQR